MVRPRKILAAIDLSETAPDVLRFAVDLALQSNAELTILNVFHADEFLRVFHSTGTRIDDFIAHLRSQIEYLMPQRAGALGIPVHIEVVEGLSISEEILSARSRFGADLVVMGTRGSIGRRHGSVAEKVFRLCTVPVLVVPAGGQDRIPRAA